MPLQSWLQYPAGTNFSQNLEWPSSKLGGYVLDIPNNTTVAKTAITASLKAGFQRGLKWMCVSLVGCLVLLEERVFFVVAPHVTRRRRLLPLLFLC